MKNRWFYDAYLQMLLTEDLAETAEAKYTEAQSAGQESATKILYIAAHVKRSLEMEIELSYWPMSPADFKEMLGCIE